MVLPADDNTLYTIPTAVTPIVTPVGRLEEADLQLVRENLVATIKAVDAHLEQMQPSAEDLTYAQTVIGG